MNILGRIYLLASFALSFSIINLLFQVSPPHAYVITASYLIIVGLETYFKYLIRKGNQQSDS
jgi:hypothetical protein